MALCGSLNILFWPSIVFSRILNFPRLWTCSLKWTIWCEELKPNIQFWLYTEISEVLISQVMVPSLKWKLYCEELKLPYWKKTLWNNNNKNKLWREITHVTQSIFSVTLGKTDNSVPDFKGFIIAARRSADEPTTYGTISTFPDGTKNPCSVSSIFFYSSKDFITSAFKQ